MSERALLNGGGRLAALVIAVALWFAIGAALVGLSIAFVDRPVARFVHDELRDGPVAAHVARMPETVTLVPTLAVVAASIALAAGAGRARVLRIGTVAMASFTVGEVAKTGLKFAFGRTWPETWTHDNASFIHDGVYMFAPFHGGGAFASFPSGHMTAAAAVMTVGWLLLPRARPLCVASEVFVAAVLLGLNYHFVGDVIAGFFLGTAVACGTVHAARRLGFVAARA